MASCKGFVFCDPGHPPDGYGVAENGWRKGHLAVILAVHACWRVVSIACRV